MGTILDLLTMSWLAGTVLRGRSQAACAEMLAQDINALNSRTDGRGFEKGMRAGMETTELGRGSWHCVAQCLCLTLDLDRWLQVSPDELREQC